MNIDSLISSYFRHSNRRYLSFDESPTGTDLPAPAADRTYLLYLHIPYCISLCPFCSFHRVRFNRERTELYFGALRREIELVTDAGFRFGEVYVGGGTPTVMPDELYTTLEQIGDRHAVDGVSVETNPVDLEPGMLERLHTAGVTRLSVGVQSFDDNLLREMQRYDSYGSSAAIIERLERSAGVFDTLNVDMIFNFPHQSEESIRRDLGILTDELGVDQVSFYPLMAANSTRKSMLRTVGAVEFDRERRFYEIIAEHMLGKGYSRNSAWCFSRRTGMYDEYIVANEEYLGLGSGAFSYLQGSLFASTFSIDHYRHLVGMGKSGTVRRRDLAPRDQMRYYLLMRLFGGSLARAEAEERFDGRFSRTLWAELAGLRAMGAIRESGGRWTLTEYGNYLWVMMMREFFTGVNNLRDEMRHNIHNENTFLAAR